MEPKFTWISPYDPNDSRGGWKAMQFHLLRAIELRLGPAHRIASIDAPENQFAKWSSRLQKKIGLRRKYAYYSDDRLDIFAGMVESRLGQKATPLVFFGALPFVHCQPERPYYIYTDSAFFIHYWEYNRDHSHALKEIERICNAEAEFMRKAEAVWCSSQWVASRITKEYGLPPGLARFVGTGPGNVPSPSESIRWEKYVVMIAADFERKGGQTAVEAVAATRRLGVELTIKFIGACPPAEVMAFPFVEWCGWLDLSKKADCGRFSEIMSRAGAQVLLSRADLTPLAIPEAATYSKATIARAVGGIPEMIRHAETGWLVSPTSGPEEIGNLLVELFRNPERLAVAGRAAHQFCRECWSWPTVADACGIAHEQFANCRHAA